jgi:hypothetical protein
MTRPMQACLHPMQNSDALAKQLPWILTTRGPAGCCGRRARRGPMDGDDRGRAFLSSVDADARTLATLK